jgi:hypothetical protein
MLIVRFGEQILVAKKFKWLPWFGVGVDDDPKIASAFFIERMLRLKGYDVLPRIRQCFEFEFHGLHITCWELELTLKEYVTINTVVGEKYEFIGDLPQHFQIALYDPLFLEAMKKYGEWKRSEGLMLINDIGLPANEVIPHFRGGRDILGANWPLGRS